MSMKELVKEESILSLGKGIRVVENVQICVNCDFYTFNFAKLFPSLCRSVISGQEINNLYEVDHTFLYVNV